MKIAQTSLSLGIVRSRSRSQHDFEIFSPFTTIQTVNTTNVKNMSPISQHGHMLGSCDLVCLLIR